MSTKQFFIAVNNDADLQEVSPPVVINDPEYHRKNAHDLSDGNISYTYVPVSVALCAKEILVMLKNIVGAGLAYREFLPQAEVLIKKMEENG